MAFDITSPRSRRAILMAGLGAIAATAAGAVARPSTASAATGDNLVLGHDDNTAGHGTTLEVSGTDVVGLNVTVDETGGDRIAIRGQGAASGAGLNGFSPLGAGVSGTSATGQGVLGVALGGKADGVVGAVRTGGTGAGLRGVAPGDGPNEQGPRFCSGGRLARPITRGTASAGKQGGGDVAHTHHRR